jgi:hypothetical protein
MKSDAEDNYTVKRTIQRRDENFGEKRSLLDKASLVI